MSQAPVVVRLSRSSGSDLHPKRAEGNLRCNIYQGWGHVGHQCRFKCIRCGREDMHLIHV